MSRSTIQQSNRRNASFLVIALALFWFASTAFAAEVAPTQPGEPSPISQPFDPLDPNNQLVQNNHNDKQLNKAQHRKGWFSWLTDFSRKPANFHYIDFIELFH